eukprot:13777707-Alexandrium_andersonii.AAC.1
MATSIQAEEAKASGAPLAHLAIDVYKAFDQLNRQIAYVAMARSGLPPGIIHAYSAFLESVTTRHVLRGGVGQIVPRICSIPQGCPLSMM